MGKHIRIDLRTLTGNPHPQNAIWEFAPQPWFVIADDHGGNMGAYWSRYTTLRDTGEQIVIDGTCSSACTLVLGIVPHDRICVTSNAVLGFHAAWHAGFFGGAVMNDPGTQTLWAIYPNTIRQWISRHGGLGTTTIYLSGPELFTMYRQCRQ